VLLIALSVASLVAGFSVINASINAAQPNSQKGCLRNSTADARLTQVGNSHVNANFKVPMECKNENFKVSLVVYKLNDGNWKNKVNNQYIFKSQTQTFSYNKNDVRKGMNVAIPQCAYQADLVLGDPVDISTGAEQNHILRAKVGGNGVPCAPAPTPTPTPVDVCPNIDGAQAEVPAGHDKDADGNCVIPVTPVEDVCPNIDGNQTEIPAGHDKDSDGNCFIPEAPVVTPVAEVTDVKVADELPNTGPGAVAAVFAGVSSLSSAVYFAAARRFGFGS